MTIYEYHPAFSKFLWMQYKNESKKVGHGCDIDIEELIVVKKLTAVLTMEDSSLLFDNDPMTRPASDFLDVKPKIITKNGNHFMVLLYIERLQPDDCCIQHQCSQ